MPIYDFECSECGYLFEYMILKTTDVPKCGNCGSQKVEKKFTMSPHVRMDPDSILKSIPDPVPPLEELRGKAKPGSETGLSDKPEASMRDYKGKKDKYGNTIWTQKEKLTIDMGRRTK